ncbi:hypothetical protein U1Q18_049531 [Sarracenia purpurea var. burkii]
MYGNGLVLRRHSLLSDVDPPPTAIDLLRKLHYPTVHMRRCFLRPVARRLRFHPPRELSSSLPYDQEKLAFLIETRIHREENGFVDGIRYAGTKVLIRLLGKNNG